MTPPAAIAVAGWYSRSFFLLLSDEWRSGKFVGAQLVRPINFDDLQSAKAHRSDPTRTSRVAPMAEVLVL